MFGNGEEFWQNLADFVRNRLTHRLPGHLGINSDRTVQLVAAKFAVPMLRFDSPHE